MNVGGPARSTGMVSNLKRQGARLRCAPSIFLSVKFQGAVAREWMAAREAELLPIPYFHVVFTLPSAGGALVSSMQCQ
jgi:hypothetical protein